RELAPPSKFLKLGGFKRSVFITEATETSSTWNWYRKKRFIVMELALEHTLSQRNRETVTGITGQDRRWYSTNRAEPSDARSRCRETPATCHFLRAALFPHREDWNGLHQNWLEQFEDFPEPASIRGAQHHALHRVRDVVVFGVRRRV